MSAVTQTGTHKVRLVVGLLSAAEELAAALAELGSARIGPHQIRIIAPVHALGGTLDAWPASEATRGFGAWVVCRPVQGSFPWALAAADAGPADPSIVEDARALLELHHWSLRRQSRQLDRHLRAGGALLLVEPDTDAEERTACTALLRHASGGVQTHEIARQQNRSEAPE
jgi:hypothetical protein